MWECSSTTRIAEILLAIGLSLDSPKGTESSLNAVEQKALERSQVS